MIAPSMTIFCCALSQIHAVDSVSKREIYDHIVAHNKTNGRTGFFVIATSEEKRLQNTLLEMGFIELVQFNRRKQYDQTIKLKMFFLEPDFTSFKNQKWHNKAIYPKQAGIEDAKLIEQPPEKVVVAPAKAKALSFIRRSDDGKSMEYSDQEWNRYWLNLKTPGSSCFNKLYCGTEADDLDRLHNNRQLAKGTFWLLDKKQTIKQ